MLYRRKIILALLQIFDGQIEKISLQKLLFLFTQKQEKPDYDFVPYRFGCFSYSANADMTAMVKRGQLSENNSHFISLETTNYLAILKPYDLLRLQEIKQQFGKASASDLMKFTYLEFPFWAINSLKAKDLLDKEQLKTVTESRPKSDQIILFTIGYEGISLEEYLNRLIRHDVKLLVDVRNNAMSMKYGFSKSQLQRFCDNLGMSYLHLPEVGIRSEQRQQLNAQEDYDRLFTVYREENLSQTKATQLHILQLLKSHQRIALTCFEANICQCHRKHLAEAIVALPDFNYSLKHI